MMALLRPEAVGRPVGTYFVIIEHLRPEFEMRSFDLIQVRTQVCISTKDLLICIAYLPEDRPALYINTVV